MPTEQFDVILSHNSQDKPQVEWLADQLEKRGLRPFLDKWELQPGRSWRKDLESALSDSKTAVVFFGPHGIGPWHDAEIDILLDQATTRRNDFRVTSILLPGATLDDVPKFLRRLGRLDFSQQWEHSSHIDELVSFVTGSPFRDSLEALPDEPAPYRGLERFEAEHADVFFGRDREVRELAQRLRHEPFVAVIGASGCGKSSLVRAGLQKAAAREEQTDINSWPVITVVPGSDPFRALADAIRHRADADQLPRDPQDPVDWADNQVLRLKSRPDGLRTLLVTLFGNAPQPTVLLIDQFEELFTHASGQSSTTPRDVSPGAERRATVTEDFIVALVDCVRSGGASLRVLITLRADFVDRCLHYPSLHTLLQDNLLLLGEPTDDGLRELIKLPAAQRGAFLETGLVELILQDFHSQTGSLPLLEHMLLTLWTKRQGRWLTLREYQSSDGLRGALDRHADKAMKFLPSDKHREVARQLFVYRLIAPGDGVPDTRRRVVRADLYPEPADRRLIVDEVLKHLSGKDARLVVLHRDSQRVLATDKQDDEHTLVEITHEALLRGWKQLGTWLNDARDRLRQHRRLSEATAEWIAEGRPADAPAYLLTGGRLEDADDLAKLDDIPFNTDEHEFLIVSRNAEQRRLKEKESQRRLFRNLSIGLAVALVIAILLSIWALDLKGKAQTLAMISDSRRIAALSEAERDKHLDRALLLAVEAINVDKTAEAWTALFKALLTRPELKMFLHADGGNVTSVAFDPEGKTLAAGLEGFDGGGGVILWRLNDIGPPLFEFLPVSEGGVQSVTFSHDGESLAAGRAGGVTLWDMTEPHQPPPMPLQGHRVSSVAFSPDGDSLYALVSDYANQIGRAARWNMTQPQLCPDIRGDLPVSHRGVTHSGASFDRITSLALSPDGKLSAEAWYNGGSSGITLRNTDAREETPWGGLSVKDRAESVAFNPDGNILAAASYRGDEVSVRLWVRQSDEPDTNWEKMVDMSARAGNTRSIVFSRDGTILAAGGGAGGVTLWNMTRGFTLLRDATRPEIYPVPEGNVSQLAFSVDGTLAAAYEDDGRGIGGVALLDTTRKSRLKGEKLPVPENFESGAFSPDNETLEMKCRDGKLVTLDLTDAASDPIAIEEKDPRILAVSPDGKILLALKHGVVALWDAQRDDSEAKAKEISNRNLSRAEWERYFPGKEYKLTFKDLPGPPKADPAITTRSVPNAVSK